MFPAQAIEILRSEDAYRRESATGRELAIDPRRRKRARDKAAQQPTVPSPKGKPNA